MLAQVERVMVDREQVVRGLDRSSEFPRCCWRVALGRTRRLDSRSRHDPLDEGTPHEGDRSCFVGMDRNCEGLCEEVDNRPCIGRDLGCTDPSQSEGCVA